MEIELKIFSSLCSTKKFIINGINADSDDFGEKGDNNTENSEEYGCGNMVFERKASTTEILEKYKITNTEYEDVAEKLEDGLSFGCCGLCI